MGGTGLEQGGDAFGIAGFGELGKGIDVAELGAAADESEPELEQREAEGLGRLDGAVAEGRGERPGDGLPGHEHTPDGDGQVGIG